MSRNEGERASVEPAAIPTFAENPEAAGELLWACVPSALLTTVILYGFLASCFYFGVSLLFAVPGCVVMTLVMAKTAANRLWSRRESARSDETATKGSGV